MRLVFLVLVLLAVPDLLAQRPGGGRPGGAPTGQILGLITDGSTGEALVGATVALWSRPDSSLTTGAITDADGRFRLDGVRPGAYDLHVSYVGYRSEDVEVQLAPRQTLTLDPVALGVDAELLEGVEVLGERAVVEQRIDRTVYATEDQAVTTGGDALDVLQTVPSLEVDQDGALSLRGSQNVVVQINGRPVPVRGDQLSGLLRSLPAEQVARVEVIPNPSAKYEPDGMSGIVNIVLKEGSRRGVGGSLAFSGDNLGGGEANGSVSYGTPKTDFYLGYGFRYERDEGSGFSLRDNFYDSDAPGGFSEEDQFGTDEEEGHSHSVNLQADYRPAPSTTLSATGFLAIGDEKETGAEDNLFFGNRADFLLDSGEGEFERSADLALALTRRFAPADSPERHQVEVEVRGSLNTEDEDEVFDPLYAVTVDCFSVEDCVGAGLQATDERQREASAQFDYVRPLASPLGPLQLEAGSRGTFRRLDNAFGGEEFFFEVDSLLLSRGDFAYDESVLAAYVTLGGQRGAFAWQGGLRAETAQTAFEGDEARDVIERDSVVVDGTPTVVPRVERRETVSSFANDYQSLFPSAFATYDLTDGLPRLGGEHQLKLSYSRRIERPRARTLNPVDRSVGDARNVRTGNPALRPEYTDALELSYSWIGRAGSLQLTPYYRRTTDAVERLVTIDSTTGVRTLTFQNFDTATNYGVESVVSGRLGAARGLVSASFFRASTESNAATEGLNADSWAFSARVNGSSPIGLVPGLSAQGFWFYRGPQDFPGGRREAFTWADLALRQALLRDRASLTLRVSDVFDTRRFRFSVGNDLFFQEGERRWSQREVSLTFSYTFGQEQKQRRQNRGGGGDDGDF